MNKKHAYAHKGWI